MALTLANLTGATLRDLGNAISVDTDGTYSENALITIAPVSRAGACTVIDTGVPAGRLVGGHRCPGEIIPGAGYRGAPLLRHRYSVGDNTLLEVVMTTKGRIRQIVALTEDASATHFDSAAAHGAWARAALDRATAAA